eukprot:6463582-Lingulodinium_polyedra.AAC.1
MNSPRSLRPAPERTTCFAPGPTRRPEGQPTGSAGRLVKVLWGQTTAGKELGNANIASHGRRQID